MPNQILIRGEKPEELPNPSVHEGFRKARPTLFAPLQIDAYQRVKEGRSCALVAPTSSGKTLAVAAPLFESKRPAVFVLPFRSLIRDQTHELPRIASIFGIDESRFGVIQGGTREKEIGDILEHCDYILMTPDKLISLLITGRKGNAAALSILSRYDFVFDEIHVFNAMMLTSLRYFLRSVKHWQIRKRKKSGFYFLSATFPDEVWQMLQEEIGLDNSDRIEGISYTGDVTLKIRPAKETNIAVIADDIRALDIETDMVGIFNSAHRAWQVCEEIGGLLFIGQDKMSEVDRIRNFDNFRD
ncbi:MAG: DEAD/DEAH box helicase, partial [Anaerolineae bacterium]|nr:DEAD/DEAH box helicase [Anaerolineae bacterium]